MKIFGFTVCVLLCLSFWGYNSKLSAADNLLLVSIAGLRWQEVFEGYQQDILDLEEFEQPRQGVQKDFLGDTVQQKRLKLMPFLWKTVAQKGVIIGNRERNSKMELNNELWFSYPGYNELLSGRADPRLDSNKAIANPNVTVLEWLNKTGDFKNSVAVFGSWDVFPAILNRQRSAMMINAGFESAVWPELSAKAKWLNTLQTLVPSPWHNVRLDAFTHGFASEYIERHQPKVIYVALGETDDFAHQGNYPEYLRGANRADHFIQLLWQQLQGIPQYKNNTNLVITVDHGRGATVDTWQHHASPKAVKGYLDGLARYPNGIPGADQVWLAAMGPDVQHLGELADGRNHKLDQVAATILSLLNQQPDAYAKGIGSALPIVTNRD
jgi:hypothetical protein